MRNQTLERLFIITDSTIIAPSKDICFESAQCYLYFKIPFITINLCIILTDQVWTLSSSYATGTDEDWCKLYLTLNTQCKISLMEYVNLNVLSEVGFYWYIKLTLTAILIYACLCIPIESIHINLLTKINCMLSSFYNMDFYNGCFILIKLSSYPWIFGC